MGEAEARAWLVGVLVEDAGFGVRDAERAVDGVFATPGLQRMRAESAATAAFATIRLPEGKEWWATTGRSTKDRLVAGDSDAWPDDRIAEIVSPAPDSWDPNWPESKTLHEVAVPEGASVGQTFVAGNGAGLRGTFRVVEVGGSLGAVLVETWSVLASESERASAEADKVF
jgi:hypothetical protein